MRNTQHRRGAPHLARSLQQGAPLLTIQTTKRLVQNDQPHATPCQGSSQAHALAFPTRHQPSALPQGRLQAVGEAVEHAPQIRLRQDLGHQGGGSVGHPIAEIVEQRTIPELDGGIHPGGDLAHPGQMLVVEGASLDQYPPGGRPVPSQEQPDQTRLARPGRPHNRHMAPRRQRQVEIREDGVPCRPHTHPLQGNGNPLAGSPGRRTARAPRRLVGFCAPLLACPQGFQEAQGGIALARVLPGEQHQLLPKCRDAEGPVGQ